MEVNIVSMERTTEYSRLETEAELTSTKPPPKDWPDKGILSDLVFLFLVPGWLITSHVT